MGEKLNGYELSFDRYEVFFDLDDHAYRDAFQSEIIERGWRIEDLSGYEVNGVARFAAIFAEGHFRDQWSDHFMREGDWLSSFLKRTQDGYQLVRDHSFEVAGDRFYSVLWERFGYNDPTAWLCSHDQHIQRWGPMIDEAIRDGFRIVDIEGNPLIGAEETFNATQHVTDGRDWKITFSALNKFPETRNSMKNLGYRAVRVSGFNNATSFGDDFQFIVGLWEKNDGRAWSAFHDLSPITLRDTIIYGDSLQQRLTSLKGFSYGHGSNARQRFNIVCEKREADPVVDTMVTRFMNLHQIPGMAIAVSQYGKLVYSRGYGFGDQTGRTPATPNTLFRVASCAKPITAVAVLRLVEQNQLKLSDHVFGTNGILSQYVTADTRAHSITVEDLLHHTSGGWPNDDSDPMFSNYSMSRDELITWTLGNTSLRHDPHTTFMYSNFGYCLLGRIIEKITRQTYEHHVQTAILAPCGITDMRIAGDTLADRLPGEAVYYGEGHDDPYAIHIQRTDSHGGWVASALDLLRFVLRVDGYSDPAQILSSDVMADYMIAPSGLPDEKGIDQHYACGWWIQDRDWECNGDLPGNTATLDRASDSVCLAAVMNTRRRSPAYLNTPEGLRRLMWGINDEVDFWPPGSPI
ncbi:serine hydrolase [Streptomyces sp. NPDC052052]|uniref:serine hydrolase n=1 Tax=Streptomyces sp. NPDC052052 TaxID=3154756 RepID=UPI00341F803E